MSKVIITSLLCPKCGRSVVSSGVHLPWICMNCAIHYKDDEIVRKVSQIIK